MSQKNCKDNIKSEVARKRWQILAKALKKKVADEAILAQSNVSVQRFSSFKIMNIQKLDKESDVKGAWFEYECCLWPAKLKVRHLQPDLTLDKLVGFNNTGNLRVWPSEEVLAHYCVKNREWFRHKNVCELGGGMTSLCGLFIALTSDANEVFLTDGNKESVNNIKTIVDRNAIFKDNKIECRLLRWEIGNDINDLISKFDYVLCSDCLFFNENHADLLATIYNILKPNGEAIIVAPSRSQTFTHFQESAESLFCVTRLENYDENLWNLHLKFEKEMPDLYDADLCYPLMLKMKKILRVED